MAKLKKGTRSRGSDRPVEREILAACQDINLWRYREFTNSGGVENFGNEYVLERLAIFRQRYLDRLQQGVALMKVAQEDAGKSIVGLLEGELYKDSLARREQAFRIRASDRTVHPTQMYSIDTEGRFETIIGATVRGEVVSPPMIRGVARALLEEYLGLNVAITSSDESNELILDLEALIASENEMLLMTGEAARGVMSFWGDSGWKHPSVGSRTSSCGGYTYH